MDPVKFGSNQPEPFSANGAATGAQPSAPALSPSGAQPSACATQTEATSDASGAVSSGERNIDGDDTPEKCFKVSSGVATIGFCTELP